MNTRGFTLLEMTFVMAISTVVMGVLFSLSLGIGDTAEIQDIQVNGNDEVQRASRVLLPLVRQAASSTINWSELPGSTLRFRTVRDLDGNGLAIDVNKNLELSPEITVTLDADDANSDGLSDTQLILIEGDTIRILANFLAPPAATGADLTSVLERSGFTVTPDGNGLVLEFVAEGDSRRGHPIRVALTEFVLPRN